MYPNVHHFSSAPDFVKVHSVKKSEARQFGAPTHMGTMPWSYQLWGRQACHDWASITRVHWSFWFIYGTEFGCLLQPRDLFTVSCVFALAGRGNNEGFDGSKLVFEHSDKFTSQAGPVTCACSPLCEP